MTEEERFKRLRNFLFDKIQEAFSDGATGKSTEGVFEITHCFPDFYEDRWQEKWTGNAWGIKLYCYVVGPSRHYEWWGGTLMDAIKKAEKEIYGWFGEKPPKEVM